MGAAETVVMPCHNRGGNFVSLEEGTRPFLGYREYCINLDGPGKPHILGPEYCWFACRQSSENGVDLNWISLATNACST